MIRQLRLWLRRNKRLVDQLAALVVAVLAGLIATASVRDLEFLAQAERYLSDWEVAALTPDAPPAQDVVVVKITEGTLAHFPYREPVDRAFLARVLRALFKDRPKAIGIDLLFDAPTEEAKDTALHSELVASPVPLAVAYDESKGFVGDRRAYLRAFVPARDRAFVNLGEDRLNVVRYVYPGARAADGRWIPSLPRKLAATAGIPLTHALQPIVWHGALSYGTPAFTEYAADAVPFLPAAWIRGKIVLIGEEVSLNDRHRTPFDLINPEKLAGVQIQADAVWQLINHRVPPALGPLENLLIALLCALTGAELGALNIAVGLRFLLGAVFVLGLSLATFALYHFGGMQAQLVAPSIAMALSLWATESLTGREARKQRAFIQGAFSHYVSPAIVEQLVLDPDRMTLDGERRVMTFLFTDIQGFTTLSEKTDGRELSRLLNAYLDGATEEVLRRGGMVDKFIGDAIFAIFNAPLDMENHAAAAVEAALAIDQFALAFSRTQKAQGIDFGITRIGVHTGPALVGNFGSRSRFNYTAQGDAVNVASRLESLNKHFGTRRCVGDSTRQLCPALLFRPIAEVILKGKTEPIAVWEPLQAGDYSPGYLARYTAAYAAMASGEPSALEAFRLLAEEAPDDPLAALHYGRLKAGEAGIAIVMEEK